MYCNHCGSQMPDDAIFCSHCGTRLVGETPEIPPVSGPAAVSEPAPAGETVTSEVPAVEVTETIEPTRFAAASVSQAVDSAPVSARPAPAAAAKPAKEEQRKPFLEEMQWNVSEYPDSNVIEKTEDIDFNWNMDPAAVPDLPVRPRVQPRPQPGQTEHSAKSAEGIRVSEIFDRVVPVQEAKAAVQPAADTASEAFGFDGASRFHGGEGSQSASRIDSNTASGTPKAAEKTADGEAEGLPIDRFQTVHRKNAEFQQLLKREHEKINVAGTIGSEQSQADAIAKERFDSRQEEMTMEEFLAKEGAVKLYEPKPLESDVLARIEAQEKQRARQKAEEEARAKALEEARAEAAAQKQAEIDRRNSEAEASAAAAEEIRLAEEAEIRQRTEEEARRKAAAQAAHLEAIAQRQAAQEQAALQEEERRAAEEARARIEAEEKARAEAEARAKAEAEAARAAEEEARRKAEAELNAAREAARIRAQQEANMAAREEARFRREQERRQYEEEMQRQRRALRARQQEQQDNETVVEAQVRDALAQTARMREEEEAKIKAALAGIRGGRFSNTIVPSQEEEATDRSTRPVEIPRAAAPVVSVAEAMGAAEEADAAASAPAEERPLFEAPAFEDIAAPTMEIPAFTEAAPAEAAAPVMEAPAFDIPAAETLSTAPDQIEEAHQATREHIDDMARAREEFFADFPDADQIAAQTEGPMDFSGTRTVSKDDLLAGIDSTKKISRETVHEADPAAAAATAAEEAELTGPAADMQKHMNEMDELLSQFASIHAPEHKPEEASRPEAGQRQVTDLPAFDMTAPEATETAGVSEDPGMPEVSSAPAGDLVAEDHPMDQVFTDQAAEDSDHMFTGFQMDDVSQVRQAAGEAFMRDAAAGDAAAQAADQVTDLPELDGLTGAFDFGGTADAANTADAEDLAGRAGEAAAIAAGTAATLSGAGAAAIATDLAKEAVSDKPGLEDTMVMPIGKEEIKAAVTAGAEEAPLSAKEQKRLAKEAKRQAKEARKNAKYAAANDVYEDEYDEKPAKSGGVGRTILMIVLILLCIVFALELAGIGIKLLAPTSGAAEFIDNILNNLIHMITG